MKKDTQRSFDRLKFDNKNIEECIDYKIDPVDALNHIALVPIHRQIEFVNDITTCIIQAFFTQLLPLAQIQLLTYNPP